MTAILACNLEALTPAQRQRRAELFQRLEASWREVEELAIGYRVRVEPAPGVLEELAEWIDLERLCCSFLSFEIETAQAGGQTWLRLTGPLRAKELLQSWLRGGAP